MLNIVKYVAGSPKIQPFSFPQSMSIGQKASVTCSVIKGNTPLKFQWMKDKKEISDSESTKIHYIDDISVLAVDPVKSNSGGNYTCIVSNNLGRDEYTAELIVKGNCI